MKKRILSKIVNSMVKVFPETEPCGEEYRSTMLKNERLNFQLVYKNEEEFVARKNRIEVRGALAPYITVRNVGLVPVTVLPLKYLDDYYLKTTVGLYPDLLKPFDILGLCLPPEQWRSVWVSLALDTDLPVGKFDTEFVLIDEQGEEQSSLVYTVEILDCRLDKTDLKLTNWMHYDCIANEHNVEPFTDEYYAVFERYLKAYVDCGFTMLLTPLFTPPLDTAVGGERRTTQLVKVKQVGEGYEFDLTDLEKFIRFVTARGIEYIEFSHLFTQWGGTACPKIVAEVNGEQKRVFGWDTPSTSKEYKAFLTALLPQLVLLMQRLGLDEKCCFHLTDEPTEEHIEHYLSLYKLVKPLIGDIPTVDALSEYAFFEKGGVDIPVPVLNASGRFRANKEIKELYLYNCCSPMNMYFSNRFINMPSQRTRILGMQLYETGVQGYLHWGFNFYNSGHSITRINPYEDTSAGDTFPGGDPFIVYPTENGGVNGSIRFEAVAEGFQDYRALKTLEGYIGRERVLAFLHEQGIEGLTDYPKSGGVHAAIKQKINAMIATYAKNA
ncbi:MAG: DUF4091 domain-containing protein [Clostridia bacterium]|nr:DUF4091 domain-containing protein [Clostridia bacterium]